MPNKIGRLPTLTSVINKSVCRHDKPSPPSGNR